MLDSILNLFGGVSPGGALALLAIGWALGAATRGYAAWLIVTMRCWYAGTHERFRDC